MNVNLDYPELGVQRETEQYSPYIRHLRSIRNYARINGFEEALNNILRRFGGDTLASYGSGDIITVRQRVLGKNILPNLKMALHRVEIELARPIKSGRKGIRPLTAPISYSFSTSAGRKIEFILDPDNRSIDTLHNFEDVLSQLIDSKSIESQFLPTFLKIKKELVSRWGWNKKEASPEATLLTIKHLCDEWSS